MIQYSRYIFIAHYTILFVKHKLEIHFKLLLLNMGPDKINGLKYPGKKHKMDKKFSLFKGKW